MIKTYYLLTKPGILMGNIITTVGGYLLIASGPLNWGLLFSALFGIALVMASACVLNNYVDRPYDAKMERTKERALVKKSIGKKSALLFALFLGLGGFFLLFSRTNQLTGYVALGGFFSYVILYSIFKYRSVYGAHIGSLAGAVPPLVGYCAAQNQFDLGAVLLFLALVFWQIPHFFAISLYRIDDYAKASIPVFPIKRGARSTKIHMVIYTLLFLGTASLLTFFGYTGFFYLSVVAASGFLWLYLILKGFNTASDAVWARSIFRYSLVVITLFSVMISCDRVTNGSKDEPKALFP